MQWAKKTWIVQWRRERRAWWWVYWYQEVLQNYLRRSHHFQRRYLHHRPHISDQKWWHVVHPRMLLSTFHFLASSDTSDLLGDIVFLLHRAFRSRGEIRPNQRVCMFESRVRGHVLYSRWSYYSLYLWQSQKKLVILRSRSLVSDRSYRRRLIHAFRVFFTKYRWYPRLFWGIVFREIPSYSLFRWSRVTESLFFLHWEVMLVSPLLELPFWEFHL